MANPIDNTTETITLSQLITALEKIPVELRHAPVAIWLPGSRIDLVLPRSANLSKTGEYLIEGNVREGSVLGS